MPIPDLTASNAQKILRMQLGEMASKELKVLVEDKHLYQKVEIQARDAAQALWNRVYL